MSDEYETGFSLLRKNLRKTLQQFRRNIGFEGKILRGRFFQPMTPEYGDEAQPKIVTTHVESKPKPSLEIQEEYDYSKQCLVRRYVDPKTGRTVKIEEIFEPEKLETSQSTTETEEALTVEESTPRILKFRNPNAPRIIDSIREVFHQSSEQIKLRTECEKLRLEALKKKLEQQQSKPKKKDEELRGIHW